MVFGGGLKSLRSRVMDKLICWLCLREIKNGEGFHVIAIDKPCKDLKEICAKCMDKANILIRHEFIPMKSDEE